MAMGLAQLDTKISIYIDQTQFWFFNTSVKAKQRKKVSHRTEQSNLISGICMEDF